MQNVRSLFSSSVIVIWTALCLLFAMPATAQVDRSALNGTVTDPSGKLLGRTHITVVENSTQLRREGLADEAGRYDIAELPVGKVYRTLRS